ncbi:MAG: alkaline phosphatase family protein [Peptococcaceae bacterium]|nr:alkaline phosphatase family protein [Peptococcaceae bacterium]
MLRNKKLADKIMVLGVDGLDPKLTRRYIDEGHLPNMKKLAEMGAQRHDLMMHGAQPTVTPPQWTTLAMGANPYVHGITQFGRTIPGKINQYGYNVDSRIVTAEPVWNCTTEAGYKTCVFHWPGGAWPPTSDSENLFVVDGSAPGSVGSAAMQRDTELIVGAGVDIPEAKFITRMVDDAVAPCVINKLPDQELTANDTAKGMQMQVNAGADMIEKTSAAGIDTIGVVSGPDSGFGTRAGSFPQAVNTCVSPIKDAKGWASAPEGAKEFSIYLCKGLVRRVGLILKNEAGIYDTVVIYKSKKDATPLVTCPVGKMIYNVIDEVIEEEKTYIASRHYKLMTLEEDASQLSMFISAAMDTECDTVIHPKRLAKALVENAGPYPPQSQTYTQDLNMQSCMLQVWDYVVDWYIKSFDYLIENEGIEVIFSHLHSVDFVEHTFIRYMGDKKGGIGFSEHDPEVYDELMRNLYRQVDRYVGAMMHYMDEGWTIMITSDHAQVAPNWTPPGIGDMCGVNADLMEELGYTVLKDAPPGSYFKKQIDWTKTRAIASQGNDIFINLKGREPHGIVDPADKYELEEQIMTDLYNYKHPDSGKRVIAIAVRNKDAILLGYGGPTAGDICFWVAEGYNYDHCDSLSTAEGAQGTSSSPIFIAAGKGLKQGYETNRVIRQVDMAPTICVMLGCRFPETCEGAPIYQILAEEL